MRVRALLLRALLGLLVSAAAGAQTPPGYPARPIRLIVPFDAGGVADLTARLVAGQMDRLLGQAMIVENRPGAGGVVATETVVRAAPDGYTCLLVSSGTAVSASLFRKLPYDTLADLAEVSTLGYFDIVLLVGANSPFRTLGELLAAARARPGSLNIGSISPGSTQNLSAELFKSMAGIDVQIVPFRSTSAVVSALRANDIQAGFEVLAPIASQVQAKALKALAIASSGRFAGLPDVPTIAEGGVPGYAAASWNGLAVPARTPASVITTLNSAVRAALDTPEVRQRLADLSVQPLGGTPQEARALLERDMAKWRAVIEQAHLEKQ